MECSCDIGGGRGGDPVHYIDESFIKTVSPCHCGECGRQIKIEEGHERWIYFWSNRRKGMDTEIMIYRLCEDCRSVVDAMFDSWNFREVWESLQGYIDEDEVVPEKCLSRVSPAAREQICEMIEKRWAEIEEEEYYER